MKRKQLLKRNGVPFVYKSSRKKIHGQDDNKHLLVWGYIDSLRWLVWPFVLLLVVWLERVLNG